MPWLFGAAIIVVLATRIPYAAFRDAISHGPHLQLAAVDLVIALLALGSDSLATWVGLIAAGLRRPLARVAAVRGAMVVLLLLNYAVGQGGFGYYLNRSGASPLRAVGTTLFLIGTNFATLLVVMPITWLIDPSHPPTDMLWWLVVIGCIAFAVYLVVIWLAPGFLARREVLAPLFTAGLRGHAVAMIGRLPHVAMIVIGQWLALCVWGVAVPFGAALTVMPAVAIASSLPVSPAGLGTSQAAMVYFFASFAVGASADARVASVLAFSIAHLVYSMLASVVIGLVCAPAARRAAVTG